MTSSLIITCYNYEKYVDRAIKSALNQTIKFDEIIFVDDGSTDTSASIAERYKEVALVKKKNGGQLSAFREGFNKSSGDIICFLDCDDEFTADHLEGVLTDFADNNIGMRFNNSLVVKPGEKPAEKNPFKRTALFTPTSIVTYYARWSPGTTTSCLAFDRTLLKVIMHYIEGLDYFWKTRTDDILNWGSSLLGARKYYNANPTTTYHIHDKNITHSFTSSPYKSLQYQFAKDIFFSRFSDIFAQKRKPHKELLAELECHEYLDEEMLERYQSALKHIKEDISYMDYLKTRIRIKRFSSKLIQ